MSCGPTSTEQPDLQTSKSIMETQSRRLLSGCEITGDAIVLYVWRGGAVHGVGEMGCE